MSDVLARSEPLTATTRRLGETMRAYVALTKPRVIELLLITTLPAMILADQGLPDPNLIAAVLVGGAFSAGGANTFNCWIERDRDQLMRRTRLRPLPQGRIRPSVALGFGLVLEALAFALLWATANLLAASLAVGAAAFYVFVYTIWLKPRTDQNIVIGGAAGAVPALVGWAAITGSLSAPAWILFTMVFLWTPPHFWALAIRYADDYAAGGFPMLPIVRGVPAATRHMLAYAVLTAATSLTLGLAIDVGPIYLATAALLGVVFVLEANRLRRGPTAERALRFFIHSNLYLAVVFVAVAVDTLVRNA